MRRKHKTGPSNFAVGAIVLLVAVIATYLGFTKSIPFRHHYEIHAVFRTANNIKPNSFVRIAGVNVGKVTTVDRLPSDKSAARVTMRIDKKGLPIHKDATIQIRPRIFLEGNFFVDIHPGSPSRADARRRRHDPGQPDQRRRCRSTRSSARCSPTRARTSSACSTSSPPGSAARAAPGFNRSIPYWKDAYERGAIASRRVARASSSTTSVELHQERGRHGRARWTATTASSRASSRTSTRPPPRSPRATADLSNAVAELPRTLRAGRPALAVARTRAFPPLRRFIRDFRPGVRSSRPGASKPASRSSEQLRLAVQPSELRGLVARPGPDRAGADEAAEGDAAALRAGPRRVELPERGDPAVDAGQDPGLGLPDAIARSSRSPRSRSAAWRASRAPATPTASGSASWSPRATTPTRRAATSS